MTNNLNKYVNYLLKHGEKVTIGDDDLTRILTRLIFRLENVQVQHKLLLFIKQTRTELAFVETLLLEKDFPLFQTNIRQWIVDLLLITMDLFNEQLYTKVSIKLLS